MKDSKHFLFHAVQGKDKSILGRSIHHVAKLSSLGFGLGVKGRTFAYNTGLFPSKRLPRFTISIGNLTVGGTGKTPLVMRLAADLMALGYKPAILIRGYRRSNNQQKIVTVRSASRILAKVDSAGDEAVELARRLPGTVIGVGSDRYEVGRYLLSRHQIDCFILDDGLQHRRLFRDINIVALDAADPWGGGSLLPSGLLREPPAALERADIVVLTRVSEVGPDRLPILKAEVKSWLRRGTHLFACHHSPDVLTPWFEQNGNTLHSLKNRPVALLSGIANPKSFESLVKRLGARIIEKKYFSDHGGELSTVLSWVHRLPNNCWILSTEKDEARWASDEIPSRIRYRFWSLRIKLSFEKNAHWGQ